MNSSFHDRMLLYRHGKLTGDDGALFLKELLSGKYDAEITGSLCDMLESPCEEDASIPQMDKDRIFRRIISSEPYDLGRRIRCQARVVKTIIIHSLGYPVATWFLSGILCVISWGGIKRRDATPGVAEVKGSIPAAVARIRIPVGWGLPFSPPLALLLLMLWVTLLLK